MRAAGLLVNALPRAAIAGVLGEARSRPADPRFAGKAIGTRGLVIIPLSLLVPVAWLRRGGSLPGLDR